MNILTPVITGLVVALAMFFVNRWYNHREKKESELSKLTSLVTSIVSRMDGIESFGKKLPKMEGRLEAQEKICESRHKWDGMERRRAMV
jgi:hypothetical protein